MPNPWVAASVITVTVSFCFFLYKVFSSNSLEERLAIRANRNDCESCGLRHGQHKDDCPMKPARPTDYRVYTENRGKGSCSICQNEIARGDVGARLPCLCTYHKRCIDRWFEEKAACPVHPSFGTSSLPI